MYGWLDITYPDGHREQVAISRVPFHIGRYHTNHLIFSEPFVSRFHMAIVEESGVLTLKDLESKSGTWVNGVRIDKAILEEGTQIHFHPNIELSFTYHKHLTAAVQISEPIRKAEAQFQAVNWLIHNIRSLQGQTMLRDISRTLLDAAMELVDADYGMVLAKSDDGRWETTALRGPEGTQVDPTSFEYSHSLVRHVQEQGEPVLTVWSPEQSELDEHASIVNLHIHNLLAIPLIQPVTGEAGGKTLTLQKPNLIGILYLDRRRPGAEFQTSDMKVLMTLADEAARSLTFAQLYARAAQQERIEQEMQWARKVQELFLPSQPLVKSYAQVHGFALPSYEVGGDFFTLIELDKDRLLFAIGDVSGKGLHASLLTALCQGAINSLANAGTPLETLVQALDRLLSEYSAPTQYITLFIGVLHSHGQLDYINAGHPPTLILNPGKPPRQLPSTAPVIGLLEAEYKISTVTLETGDLLVLYTDGMYDRIIQNKPWSLEEWIRWASDNLFGNAVEVCTRMKKQVINWSTEGLPSDDITFLALSYQRQGESSSSSLQEG